MRISYSVLFVIVSALIVSACSDGSDGPGSDVRIGFLVDSAVSGVAYETPTHGGVTGPDGSFHYEEGENVRFSVGDTLVGEVVGKEQVTRFDLAGSAVITGTKAITRALQNARDPFHTVTNIAVLLRSLDRDADGENGIEIAPEVAALFQGVDLDLGQHWTTFPSEFELRRAIAQANAQGLFSETHGLITPAMALDHLYQSMEIDARIFGRNFEQIDENADSTPEEIYRWEYDGNGNLTRHEIDDGADGTPDHIMSYSYDSLGRLTQIEDGDGDGNFRVIEAREYDAIGNLVHGARIDNEVGNLNFANYEYDTSGNQVRVESGYVFDGETIISDIATSQFNELGDVTRREVDVDNDGIPDNINSWQYDARGNTTRYDEDEDGNGTPDQTEMWQYDEYDNVTRYEYNFDEHDSDTDGTTNYLNTWRNEYNDSGQLVRAEQSEGPQNHPLTDTTYHYDADGNLSRVESIREVGSRVEHLWIVTYEYDSEGNLTREAFDELGPGANRHLVVEEYDRYGNLIREADRRERAESLGDTLVFIDLRVRTWDEMGRRVTRHETDTDADGMPDRVIIFKVDEHGNLTEEYEDLDGDGTPDELGIVDYLYELDGDGNLIREEIDNGGDGTVDTIADYEYEPTGWGHLFSPP